MKDYINKIHNCDCLEFMKTLPDNCVDLVLTDPPYGTNDGKGKVIRRGNSDVNFSTLEWDKKLPLHWIKELPRTLKDDRWGCVFTDNKAVDIIWRELEQNGLSPRNTFYWYKTNKAPTPRSNFKSCVETAIVFTKGRTNKKWFGGATQNNMIQMPFCQEGLHPTQKPVGLFRFLLKLFTEDSDVIFDPFMGSGTTAVAAYQMGRQWFGCELSKEYCDIANKRIADEQNNLFELKI